MFEMRVMHRLRHYIQGVREHEGGDDAKAAESISRALGSEKSLPVVEAGVGKFADPSDTTAEVITRLMQDTPKEQ